jgi:hypothetical protein
MAPIKDPGPPPINPIFNFFGISIVRKTLFDSKSIINLIIRNDASDLFFFAYLADLPMTPDSDREKYRQYLCLPCVQSLFTFYLGN